MTDTIQAPIVYKVATGPNQNYGLVIMSLTCLDANGELAPQNQTAAFYSLPPAVARHLAIELMAACDQLDKSSSSTPPGQQH
jgi:hypothetical protein